MIQIFCGYTGLLNTIACFSIAVFLYFKNPNGKINRSFAVFSLCVAFWSLSYFIWLFTLSYDHALIWARLAMASVIAIPAAFLHFVLIYLNADHRYRYLLTCCYALTACYLLLDLTPLYIQGVEHRFWFSWWPVPGILFYPFQIYFIVAVLYAHVLLFRAVKTAESEIAKKQLRMVGYGTLIAFLGGSTNFFLWYNIPVPPVFNFLVTGYVAFIAYAILHYKLWDIEFIIRRTIVFTGILGLFLLIFSSLTYFLNLFISSYVGIQSNLAAVLAFAIGIASYRPVEKFLVKATDHYLFQKKYDYQKVLKDASRGMARIESLAHLMRLVIHFVTMRIRIKNAAAVFLDEAYQCFKVVFARGYGGEWNYTVIPVEHPLIQYLGHEKEALDMERVKELQAVPRGILKKGEKQERFYDFNAMEKKMNELQAACVVPSFLGKELKSILVLGEKKSGDVYSDTDMNVLFTLAQESAIAIENARLYDEAINKSRELEKINQQLEDASRRLMLALNEAEDANKRLLDTQAQLIHEQKMATLGRLAASVGHEVNNPLTILSMNVSRMILKYRKDPNVRVADISEYFEKMESNIQRIKAVVNTLTGLLKKSEKGKFEALSLKLVIEETLPLVQFQTYLDNLTGTEVEFDIPANVPLIKGDLERLQEVFLNLFTNAYHALFKQRERRIRVCARVDENNPKLIVVDFTDNGCGMDEETANKIFNYGFTTKGEGKGSGIGLYMCRYILEIHGGEIKVRSKKEQGTTFTLTLPIYEEQAARIAR